MNTQTKKHTILIVEDEPALRNALREKLIHEGFFILEAKNGEEGLRVALQEHPDLILLDIIMPKMDGLTMFRTLRLEGEYGKHVHVILLTNLTSADEERDRDVRDLEPAYYLVKTDWQIDEVVRKIRGIWGE